MNILIVAPYCSLPGESGFNRFLYLAELLSENNNVTLLTSRFRHYDKSHRVDSFDNLNLSFSIVLLDEPGYTKNVSIQRVYSHHVFCNNLKEFISVNNDYDVVYSAYPLIETNLILNECKVKYDFKLVIDVQDVWPESFSSYIPLISKIPRCLIPFSKKANRAYNSADAIVAVSETYLNLALSSINKKTPAEMVYIGSDFKKINANLSDVKKSVFSIAYIGTLSHSYDLDAIIRGFNAFVRLGYNAHFHIYGGGPFESKLKSIACDKVYFHGYVDFEVMVNEVSSCHAAVNAIAKGAPQSVTNKLSDYLSIGLPLINSQMTSEISLLLNETLHVNYEAGSEKSALEALVNMYGLYESDQLKLKPNKCFDREKEYKKITDLIHGLVEKI